MSLLLLLDGQSRGVPGYLPGLSQRFLDQRPRYHDSTVNALPILTPEESGAIAIPRAGRCVTFDGVNDYASRADSNLKPTGGFSAFLWIKTDWSTTFNDGLIGAWDGTGYMVYADSGLMRVFREGEIIYSDSMDTVAYNNVWTHVAGKHGNPYSRVVPNVWNAPELVNIGYTSSVKLAPTDAVQSISPADTKFRRTKTDGDDRYFSTREALTSTNKTNAEAYVA